MEMFIVVFLLLTFFMISVSSNGCYDDIYHANNISMILDSHNAIRSLIAQNKETNWGSMLPVFGAKSMKLLRWDPSLAKLAQSQLYASRIVNCWQTNESEHIDPNYTTQWGSNVGENIYKSVVNENSNTSVLGEAYFWKKAIDAWHNEVSLYNASFLISYDEGHGCGNFTQMIWDQTYAIGCAWAKYFSNAGYQISIACEYAPKGNIRGNPVYEQGTPCCPDESTCIASYPSVCNCTQCSGNSTNCTQCLSNSTTSSQSNLTEVNKTANSNLNNSNSRPNKINFSAVFMMIAVGLIWLY